MGCQTAVDCAVRYPDRVTHLVLQGPSGDPQGRSTLRMLGRLLLDSPREPLSENLLVLLEYWQCGPARLLRTCRYMLQDRIEEKLPHVRMPALVVWGERDPIAPQRWAEEMTRLLPRGRLVVMPGGAHTLNYEAPQEMAQLGRVFLTGAAAAD